MPLIYITGAPGIGKTTLQHELAARGYDARDIDSPEFGGPYNIATNEKVSIPEASARTPEWFNEHEWRVDVDAFRLLQQNLGEDHILILGVADSDDQILNLFDKIIYLELSDEELTARILTREDNDYGKNDFELKAILRRKRALDRKYLDLNIARVNVSGTVQEAVGKLLAIITISPK